jgi:hypothetical protein
MLRAATESEGPSREIFCPAEMASQQSQRCLIPQRQPPRARLAQAFGHIKLPYRRSGRPGQIARLQLIAKTQEQRQREIGMILVADLL